MNKRPVLLRTLTVLVVVLVFTVSLYPLVPKDYYETFVSLLRDQANPAAAELVRQARVIEKKENLYQSQALLKAAEAKGIELAPMLKKAEKLEDNRDVLSLIRKEASGTIRLGLDLNGGVEFMLQLVPDEDFLAKLKGDGKTGESRETMEKRMRDEFDHYRDVAIEILRKRLEGQKIFEAEIAPSGSDYVALRAPVVTKDEKLKLMNLIKMSAKLNFRLVHENNQELVNAYLSDPAGFQVPYGYELMKTSEFRKGDKPLITYFMVSKRSEMTGKGVTSAYATKDEYNQRKIYLRFNQQGAQDFARVTGENVGRQLAIVLDGQLYCAPSIRGAIPGGSAEISGSFTEEEAKSIADALVSGSFPFQIKVNAVFDTDPKLGASNVSNGIWVGLISLLAVAIFMIVYYRLCGFIADVALALNIVLILGAMAAFDCTLTLPGIAGIVLTIGMAVDANVLVFERIREELKLGKNLRNSVDLGYEHALSAVMDANITTLIVSIILMYVGTGAVKGFAVTLSIGILSSLFSALFLTRLIFDYLFRFGKLESIHMMQFLKDPKINFMKLWPKAVTLSLTLIVLTFALCFYRGSSMLGIDFTGGTQITFDYADRVAAEQLEKTLKKSGFDASVTYKHNALGESKPKLEVLVRGDFTEAAGAKSPRDKIAATLMNAYPALKLSGGVETTVGGLIGMEFVKAACWAIFFSFIGIAVYVSIRYVFIYALSGILALLHDVIICLGIFLATGRSLSLTAVAAFLTVIGYSINDTVVIFDRIRENGLTGQVVNYYDNVNTSVNQTLNRTLLTSITTFIVVFLLFVAGGAAINDFAFIMLLGVIVGTYSSVFLSAPLVAHWRAKMLHQELKSKIEADAAKN